jgi:hypothetical protein
MNYHRSNRQIANFVITLLTLAFLATQFSVAQEIAKPAPVSAITIAQLAGTWTATFSGNTGCGQSTLMTTFTLDASGRGIQTAAVEHTMGCGDIDQSGQLVNIHSLNPDGSGAIGFGCGTGCGFVFSIQVARNRQVFNLGPELDSGNYLAGVAIRK